MALTEVKVEEGQWVKWQYRVFGGGVDTYKQIHTRTVKEQRGGTYAEASAYVTANPAGTGNTVSCNAVKDGHVFWKVVHETDEVTTDWTLVT